MWNGKKAKIAYNILQLPKHQGGLGLISLKCRDYALKATWPHILAKETEYASMVYAIMRVSTLGADIWSCSIAPEDVKTFKFDSQFWKDVLYSWALYNYFKNSNLDNQVIWYNSRLRLKNKGFFWSDCYKKGLKYVYQLFEEGQLLPAGEMLQRYGVSQLRYNSIISVIPGEWKEHFKEISQRSFLPLPPNNYERVMLSGAKDLSKNVYQYILEDPSILMDKFVKWKQEVGFDNLFQNSVYEFARSFRRIYQTTNVARYRSFQFRLQQRALVTNIHLVKWGMAESDLCELCKVERETMLHLFVKCEKTKKLWEEVKKYLKDLGAIEEEISMQPANILFNTVLSRSNSVANFIVLITKYYIYSQRCMGKSLFMKELEAKLRHVQNIEKFIAVKNNKLGLHYKKWNLNFSSDAKDMDIDMYVQQYVQNMS